MVNVHTSSSAIDNTDYAILHAVKSHGTPLWKSKIHEYISQHHAELPIPEPVSVQTVGRRVDTLAEDGYLENMIISPDELQRDLIIGYALTDAGEDAINRKRQELLEAVIRDALFQDATADAIGKDALITILNEEFALSDDAQDEMPSYSRDELAMLLTMHYTEQRAGTVFEDGKEPVERDMSNRISTFRKEPEPEL